MIDETQRLERLKELAIDLFVKNNNANINDYRVIAGIIDAASHIASFVNISTVEDTKEILLKAFNVTDNNLLLEFLNILNPSITAFLIDYQVDYREQTSVMIEYHSKKEQFDELFSLINSLRINRNKNL